MTEPKIEPMFCPFCGEAANSDVRDNQWTVACCACPAGQVTGFDTEQEAVAAWNRRCKPTSDDPRRTAAAQLKSKLGDVLKAESAALEKLTLDQLTEAVIHACECGDFMRHVVVDGRSEFVPLTDHQAVTYIPARKVQQLKARIAVLERAAEALTEAVRDADRRYDFDSQGPLMWACRDLERVVEGEVE